MKLEILGPFVLYMLVMLGSSFYFYRRTKTRESFHLAGRGLNSWVAGFSASFSGMSGWMLIGYTGISYLLGPSIFWMMTSYLVGVTFGYTVYGSRLRNYSEILGAVTYPEFFARRVRDETNIIRLIGATATVFFMAVYVGSQYVSGAIALSPLLNISYNSAMILTFVGVTLYCLTGGLNAVAWLDYFRGIAIIIITIISAYMLLKLGGGWSASINKIGQISPNLVNVSMGGKVGAALIGAVLAQISLAGGTVGRPHDTIRFFAIDSSKEVPKARFIGVTSLAIPYFTCFMIGYLGRIFFPTLDKHEQIFPMLMQQVFHPFWSGLLLVGLVAFVMTTVDSQLLSAASSVAEDFYRPFFNPNASDQTLVMVSRIAVLLVSVVGLVFGMTTPDTMFWFTIYAGNGLACTFLSVLILSLYWKGLTKWGVAAGMVTGFLTTVIWYNMGWRIIMNEVIPGHVFSCLAAVIVSLITANSIKEHHAKISAEIELAKGLYSHDKFEHYYENEKQK